MPAGVYIPKTIRAPRGGQEVRGLRRQRRRAATSQTAAVGATGPYLVEGCALPADVPPAVADLLPYFQPEGTTAPALEFLSPIKGPALEQITVEVGSGIRSAAEPPRSTTKTSEAGPAARPSRLVSRSTALRSLRPGVRTGAGSSLEGGRPMAVAAAAERRACGRGLRRGAAPASPYPNWFYLPAAIIFGVLFLFPTVASLFF